MGRRRTLWQRNYDGDLYGCVVKALFGYRWTLYKYVVKDNYQADEVRLRTGLADDVIQAAFRCNESEEAARTILDGWKKVS